MPSLNTMVFFALPTDLQICILKTWLANSCDDRPLMQALASLETSHLFRDQWTLLARLPLLWRASYHSRNYDSKVDWWSPGVIEWLFSRQIPVRVLHISGLRRRPSMPAARLVSVETIEFGAVMGDSRAIMEHVLASCPNLTSIIVSNTATAVLLAKVIGSFIATNIQHLTLTREVWLDNDALREVFNACVHGLRELHIASNSVSNAFVDQLSKTCPHLQVFDVGASYLTCANMREFLRSSVHLSELTLRDFRGTEADLHSIIALGQLHLKRVSVMTDSSTIRNHSCHVFADLVNHQWLEFVELNDCFLDRPNGHLVLTNADSPPLSLDSLEQLLSHCRYITRLRYVAFNDPSVGSKLILMAKVLGAKLRELSLTLFRSSSKFEEVAYFLQQAPLLTSLCLTCTGAVVCSDLVTHIPSHCKELQHLYLNSPMPIAVFSNSAIDALLANCHQLTSIKFVGKIALDTSHFLQTILSNRVRLGALYGPWTAKEICEFRRRARVEQLLPVPRCDKLLRCFT